MEDDAAAEAAANAAAAEAAAAAKVAEEEAAKKAEEEAAKKATVVLEQAAAEAAAAAAAAKALEDANLLAGFEPNVEAADVFTSPEPPTMSFDPSLSTHLPSFDASHFPSGPPASTFRGAADGADPEAAALRAESATLHRPDPAAAAPAAVDMFAGMSR